MIETGEERALVALARAGDLPAFEVLVRRRMAMVYRLELAILGDEEDAADAAQETFIVAWRKVAGLREVDRFEAWLQRVAVNAARSMRRSRARRQIRELPMGEWQASGVEPQSPEASRDAEALRLALGGLSHDHRAVLALHHLEGRSVQEIAAMLGIPEGTAKSRLFKARAALNRALREGARA